MGPLTATEWIDFFSAVGTLFSSVFVWRTLVELRTQRKQSYKPDLVIPDAFFYYDNLGNSYPEIWKSDENKYLRLEVHNIGLGVAKSIQFDWSYDRDSMLETFHKLSESTQEDLFIDDQENRIYHTKGGEILDGSSLTADSSSHDFLFPYGSNKNIIELNLPNSYICISTAILGNAKISEIFDINNNFSVAICPTILTINYRDVGGSKIVKKFKIDVRFFSKSVKTQQPFGEKISKMRGRVYVAEI